MSERESDASKTRSPASKYARAGVDLDRDEAFTRGIGRLARATFRPEVLSSIGGFAGLFKAPERYQEPVFVASTDGVGTKLKLAAQLGRYDTVGIDCVAMVVNDLVVLGAEPIVFLDYLAMGEFDPKVAEEALRGVVEGCRRGGCALLGGESASMPGVYPAGEIELVGFGVGVVERDHIIDGSTIARGDVLVGVASSGCHSNGYSLARKIVDEAVTRGKLQWRAENEELNGTLAAALVTPTRIYVKPILNLMRDFALKGMVHITGGGFEGNVPRVLPKGVRARIHLGSWPVPPIFGLLQRHGGIDAAEMMRVFNYGIGMIVIVSPPEADDVIGRLRAHGERAYRIGEIESCPEGEPAVALVREGRSIG